VSTISFIIPCGYWLKTRLRTWNQKASYLLSVLLPQIAWLALVPGDFPNLLRLFAVYFLGMIVCYELGYMDNDYRAQRREEAAGFKVRKESPPPMGIYAWILAVALRIGVFVSVVFYAAYVVGAQPLLFILAVLIMMTIFTIHNSLLGFPRVFTFFGLYWIRLQLPVISALSFGDLASNWILAWEIFCFVYSLCFSFSYAVKRHHIPAPVYVNRMNAVQLALLPASFIILGLGGGVWLIEMAIFKQNDIVSVEGLILLGTILLLNGIGWGVFRFARGLHRALSRAKVEIIHAHTNLSHDGAINMALYQQLLLQNNIKKVYITDHAEDFSPERYEWLVGECKSRGLVPGLEFSLNGETNQHFLAHNLSRYISTNNMNLEQALAELSRNSERVIWAHPRIAFRKLRKPAYWREMLQILAMVDGVEVYNPKEGKRAKFILSMVAIAWLSAVFYGFHLLLIGQDFHRPEELTLYERGR